MISLTLSQPIQAHGEAISTLELKAPSCEQIQRNGLPVSTDSNGNFIVNAQVALKYIPELAGIPPSSLSTLSAYDINNICWAVWRFFMTPPDMLTNV